MIRTSVGLREASFFLSAKFARQRPQINSSLTSEKDCKDGSLRPSLPLSDCRMCSVVLVSDCRQWEDRLLSEGLEEASRCAESPFRGLLSPSRSSRPPRCFPRHAFRAEPRREACRRFLLRPFPLTLPAGCLDTSPGPWLSGVLVNYTPCKTSA